jgi:hypothetical protein
MHGAERHLAQGRRRDLRLDALDAAGHPAVIVPPDQVREVEGDAVLGPGRRQLRQGIAPFRPGPRVRGVQEEGAAIGLRRPAAPPEQLQRVPDLQVDVRVVRVHRFRAAVQRQGGGGVAILLQAVPALDEDAAIAWAQREIGGIGLGRLGPAARVPRGIGPGQQIARALILSGPILRHTHPPYPVRRACRAQRRQTSARPSPGFRRPGSVTSASVTSASGKPRLEQNRCAPES